MNAIIDTRRIRTVWVDLDDTIIDFRGNSRRALSRVHAVHPAVSRLFPDAEAWIEAYERHNLQLWALYNRAEITCAFLREERFIRPLADASPANSTGYISTSSPGNAHSSTAPAIFCRASGRPD